jgi:hypothetical protein
MRIFHNPNAFQRPTHSCGGKIKDKQLTVSHTENKINPYFPEDPNLEYLTNTDQMEKFKPTEYYIVYDFETMEDNSSSSSSSFS